MAEVNNVAEARELADAIHAGQLTGPDAQAATAALERFAARQDAQPAGDWKQYQYSVSPEQQAQSNIGVLGAAVRAPTAAAEGFGQAAVRVGAALGITSPEYVKNYEDAVKANREEFARTNNMGQMGLEVSNVMSGFVPIGGALVSAERAGGRLLSYLWNIGKGGAVGATMATANVTPSDESKLGETAWGAGLGASTAGILGVLPASRNVVQNIIQDAETNVAPRIRQAVADARQFFAGSSVQSPPLTLAQQSGNPVIQRLEQQARGAKMNELYARQADAARDRFAEIADAAEAAGGKAVTAGGLTEDTHKLVMGLTRDMKRVANDGYSVGLAEVEALGKGNFARVPTPNLQTAYRSVMAERANPFTLDGETIPDVKNAMELLAKLDKAGGADASTIAQVMRGLNQGVTRGEAVLTPQQAAINRVSRQLRDALDKDLEAGLSAGNMPVPAGVQNVTRDPFDKLAQVRKQYAERRARITRLENDGLSRIFGSEEVLASPRAALGRFYQLPPEDMKYAVEVLAERSPEILQGMRADRLRQMLQAANVPGPANASLFDPAKFRAGMYDGQDGVVNTHLWDDATRKRMLEGASHLRVLQQSLGGIGGTPVAPSDVTINAVSRNPAFMTRLATRLAYGHWGDELLGTEAGLRALRTATTVGKPRGQASAAATAWMIELLNREAPDEEEKK